MLPGVKVLRKVVLLEAQTHSGSRKMCLWISKIKGKATIPQANGGSVKAKGGVF